MVEKFANPTEGNLKVIDVLNAFPKDQATTISCLKKWSISVKGLARETISPVVLNSTVDEMRVLNSTLYIRVKA